MHKTSNKFLVKLSELLPDRFKVPLEESAIWAQLNLKSLPVFIGILIVFFFAMGIVISLLLFFFTKLLILLPFSFIVGVLLVYFIIRSLLAMLADTASRQIEKVLPDMLMLMAANLRAGMIPENSFLASIRPEFGRLNVLLSHAAIEVQGGKNFREAIVEMSNMTNSKFFNDTMRVIAESLRSGAELHLILENLAQNILQNETIRNDMKAQVRSYSLFIFLASTIAAPLLYGVASFLIGVLDKIGSVSATTSVPISTIGLFSSFSLPHISANLITLISIINVAITTSSSAILNSILNTGNAKNGLKAVPIFLLIGLAIFFMVRFGIGSFFASSLLTRGGGI